MSEPTKEQKLREEEKKASEEADKDDAVAQQLQEEHDQLLLELNSSQKEVELLIAQQGDQESELQQLKDDLAAELLEVQDEAWKLKLYNELEVLKKRLAAVSSLEDELDAAEAVLDGPREQGNGAVAAGEDGEGDEDEGEEEESEGEYNEAEVEALQDKLDAELADMYEQLRVVKEEAARVSAQKAALELELLNLLKGMDEMSVEDELAIAPETVALEGSNAVAIEEGTPVLVEQSNGNA